jgi:hypothetical protein
MTPYAIALFFHFVGMIGLFVGYGLEWTGFALLRRAATAEEARSSLGLYRLSMPVSGPGLLILLLSGGYLASIAGGMKQGWILGALFGIFLLIALGLVLIQPRVRELRKALPDSGATVQTDSLALAKSPMLGTLVRVRFLLTVGIVGLMTAKPQALGTALAVLLGAMIIGAIVSIGLWAKASR